MSQQRSRRWATLGLVVGSVAFGIVVAGGIDLTAPGTTAPSALATPGEVSHSAATAGGLPSFADLAEAVSPAVVSVRAVTIEERRPMHRVDPFEFFFGPRRGPESDEPEERRSESGGSGFLINRDGLIVTNFHVVDGATDLRVNIGNREYAATVKGTDRATDIALLEVELEEEPIFLKLGDSDALRVGDWVMAIGSPLRLESSVTVGVVSAKGRSLGISERSFENFIQTDAAINFGNSGGPLISLNGEVVGINTAINWGAENIGFAVPVNTLKAILPQLVEEGRVQRGYLGVDIANVDYRRKEAFGLESTEGALVESVRPHTPAEDAGLEHGDVILQVDEVRVRATRDLIDYISQKAPGTEVTLVLMRSGRQIEKRAVLAERPGGEDEAGAESEEETGGIDWLGISYQEMTPGVRSSHGIPDEVDGVWVRGVSPRSPLVDEGIRAGDIITEVNGRETPGVEEFERVVEDVPSGSFLRLYVERFDARTGRSVQFFAFARVP